MLMRARVASRTRPSEGSPRGQTLVEMSLVAPLFFMVFFGILVLGLGVFYQQVVTNAAREGARFAALNTATSRCPTVSNLSPDVALLPLPNSYSECDKPSDRWPRLAAAARIQIYGFNAMQMQTTACWSGYWTKDTSGAWAAHDEIAVNADGTINQFRECTVPVYGWTAGQDPDVDASALQTINPRTRQHAASQTITVDCSRQFPITTVANDTGSSYSKSNGRNANQVTVLTCYGWTPPLAGFLLIPETIHMTGAVTESLEYQQ